MSKFDLYITQEKCRYFLSDLLGINFISDRSVLVVDDDKRTILELDGYNAQAKIAFEYQGQQHYNYIEYFHGNYENFLNQKKRDELKKKLCIEKGIDLLIIPYYEATTDENLMKYITELAKNIIVDKSSLNYNASLTHFYKNEFIPQQTLLLDIVTKNNGRLIGIEYDGEHHNAIIICQDGHQFSSRVGQIIKQYIWCSTCASKYKYRLLPALQTHMKLLAEERGGKCFIKENIDQDYKSKETKVSHQANFICKNNHKPFTLTKTQFINGEWCPTCAMPILEQIKLKGGICMKYTPFKPSKITIRCSNRKHRCFQLSEEEIIGGKWCPNCISEINNAI